MDSRAQFEEWYVERYGEKYLSGDKHHSEFCDAWEIWQASRAAIEIELPAQKPFKHNSYPEARAQDDGFNDALVQCAESIMTMGIGVKCGDKRK